MNSPGAWTLCGLYVVAYVVVAPLLWGTPLIDQLRFLLGFDGVDSVAIGLAIVFGALTAVAAAVAGSVRTYAPAKPPGLSANP